MLPAPIVLPKSHSPVVASIVVLRFATCPVELIVVFGSVLLPLVVLDGTGTGASDTCLALGCREECAALRVESLRDSDGCAEDPSRDPLRRDDVGVLARLLCSKSRLATLTSCGCAPEDCRLCAVGGLCVCDMDLRGEVGAGALAVVGEYWARSADVAGA